MRIESSSPVSSVAAPTGTASPEALQAWAAALPHQQQLNPKRLSFDLILHEFLPLPHGKLYPEERLGFRASLQQGKIYPFREKEGVPVSADGTFYHPRWGKGRFTPDGKLQLAGCTYSFEVQSDRVAERAGPYARPIRWQRFRTLTYGGFPPRTESSLRYTA